MPDQRSEEQGSAQEQPGTVPTNPGDQVPPGTAGAGENVCADCGGSGRRDDQQCATCGGTGIVMQAIGGA